MDRPPAGSPSRACVREERRTDWVHHPLLSRSTEESLPDARSIQVASTPLRDISTAAFSRTRGASLSIANFYPAVALRNYHGSSCGIIQNRTLRGNLTPRADTRTSSRQKHPTFRTTGGGWSLSPVPQTRPIPRAAHRSCCLLHCLDSSTPRFSLPPPRFRATSKLNAHHWCSLRGVRRALTVTSRRGHAEWPHASLASPFLWPRKVTPNPRAGGLHGLSTPLA